MQRELLALLVHVSTMFWASADHWLTVCNIHTDILLIFFSILLRLGIGCRNPIARHETPLFGAKWLFLLLITSALGSGLVLLLIIH